jgi:hypothetical protein
MTARFVFGEKFGLNRLWLHNLRRVKMLPRLPGGSEGHGAMNLWLDSCVVRRFQYYSMKVSFAVTGLTLFVGLLFESGCAGHRTAYAEPAQLAVPHSTPRPPKQTPITEAPPPPQVEVVGTAPNPDYVWIPGRWEWQDGWTWMSGFWATAPHPQAEWIPGRWVKKRRGWIWIRGYWR